MEANEFTRQGAALLLGEHGEEEVAGLLTAMGFEIEHVGGQSFDLLLAGRVTVEVKTALPTGRSDSNGIRWQFLLHKRSRGRPLEEHVLILRCQNGIGEDDQVWHFVIPGHLPGLGHLAKLDITSRPDLYKGKYSLFLNAWGYIPAIIAQAEKEDWPDPREKKIPF